MTAVAMLELPDDAISLRDRAVLALAARGLSTREIARLRLGDLWLSGRREFLVVRLVGNANDGGPRGWSRRSVVRIPHGPERSAIERYVESIDGPRLRSEAPLFPGRREGRPISQPAVVLVLARWRGKGES